MNIDSLVKILDLVPAKKLRLVELAWELADRRGRVDMTKARERLPEIAAAADEADAYARATASLVNAIERAATEEDEG